MTHDVVTTRIVIADDHPIFRDGLRRLLESEQGFEIVGEAVDAITAVTLVREHTPDILLLDLFMPYGGGIAALRDLAIDPPPTRIILLTAAIEPGEIVTAVHLGARGIITKDSATALLFKCIQRVIAGEYWLDRGAVGDLVQALVAAGAQEGRRAGPPPLTRRELEIIAAVVEGASNREVADRFGLSPQTVKNHLSNIFDKLGVSNRLELALYAVNHQLFPGRRDPPSRPPGSSR
jgi:two-component system nitrate/nitrite response regulator NarL